MTTAIFIDGPLAGEVMALPPEIGFEFRVPLPRRVTNCYCDGLSSDIIEPEVFVYHRIMQSCAGESVALFSKGQRAEAVLSALKEWVTTDLHTSRLVRTCRDRRAYE